MSYLRNSARTLFALIGVLSALFGFPWLTALAILLLSIRYRAYEALFIGLFTDFLWQPAGLRFPMFTFGALLALWAFEPIRTEFLK